MRTSITSGSSAAPRGLRAVRGLPDDLDVVLALALIVRDQDAHHQAASSSGSRARTTYPPPSRGPCSRSRLQPARRGRACPRARGRPRPSRRRSARRSRSRARARPAPVHRDPGVGRPCVLERVQRLLDDAVGSEVDSRLQLARLPLDLELDRGLRRRGRRRAASRSCPSPAAARTPASSRGPAAVRRAAASR